MKTNTWTIIVLSLAALLILILTKGEKIMKAAVTRVWDFISEQRINTLHPMIRNEARAFINDCETQGIKLRVTAGFRSIDEQNKLYAKGRTEPGKVVTNARGGQSFHNYGLALDVVEMKDGVTPLWNNTNWEKIGSIGKKYGFEWGGDWTSFTDKPHFQKTFGNDLAQLQARYNAGNLPGGYVALA
jgi:peptidoglycan L-alanyl-D-glutamate endopeptidase CwlK